MKKSLNYLKKISRWLLPYTCILCGAITHRDQDLCDPCRLDLPKAKYACSRCARPLSRNQSHLINTQHPFLCDLCSQELPPFDSTYALYLYHPPITKLIMDLKFGQALVNARVLGELLAMKIQIEWYQDQPLPQVILPIPLHAKRLKERGFNQAIEIARPLAKNLRLPLDTTLCKRIKPTAAQATLPASERQVNIKNAFFISHVCTYRHVAVLDDVITTGHTMTEFCRTLKLAGVHRIDVWCCARPVSTQF